MGTLHYAVNTERKVAYALRKGSCWYDLPSNATSFKELRSAIEKAHQEGTHINKEDDWSPEYDRWAAELLTYVPFIIINDNEDDSEKFAGVQVTGSRFLHNSTVGEFLGPYESRPPKTLHASTSTVPSPTQHKDAAPLLKKGIHDRIHWTDGYESYVREQRQQRLERAEVTDEADALQALSEFSGHLDRNADGSPCVTYDTVAIDGSPDLKVLKALVWFLENKTE